MEKKLGPRGGAKQKRVSLTTLESVLETFRRRVQKVIEVASEPMSEMLFSAGETRHVVGYALRKDHDISLLSVMRVARVLRVPWLWLLGAGDESHVPSVAVGSEELGTLKKR